MLDLVDANQIEALKRQDRWSSIASPLHAPMIGVLMHLVYRYNMTNIDSARRLISRYLAAHRGPIICVANHLTHLDPYFVSWVLLPIRHVFHPSVPGRISALPWVIADEAMYTERKGWSGFLLRWWTYCSRTLYVRRLGEEAEAVRSRETLFSRALWALNHSGWVGFFPEAKRSRSGWLEAGEPKPLAGELGHAAPGAAFLCLYIRGEHQKTWCHFPNAGESFRVYVDWIAPAEIAGEPAPEITRKVFERLGRLQEAWFKESSLPKNCGGCAVVDLREVRSDAARVQAARSAACAALSAAGLPADSVDVDLFLDKAVERTTRTEVRFRFVAENAERVVCVAVVRGGLLGNAFSPGDVLWRVESLPIGATPSSFAGELLLRFIAESSDDIHASELELELLAGVPKVRRQGTVQDWGVSFSHSGRFAACSFMTS
jgi:1-acyl-sn-glycerol-3-phosphate acyltransferase